MTQVAKVNILGVSVGAYTMDSLLAQVESLIAAPGCAVAYAVTAHTLHLTYQHPDFLEAIHQADVVYADGASLVPAARLLKGRIPEKLATADLWPRLCELAVLKGYRFFLVGGEPGLAERAKAKAIEQYPGLQIVSTHHGYFDLADEQIVTMINAVRPHILWVGMGDPRQLLWVEAVKKHLEVALVIPCGGMFKIIAGDLQRISFHWRQRGFEWAYRLIQEPAIWRRYLLELPVFAVRVLAQRFYGHRAKHPSKSPLR